MFALLTTATMLTKNNRLLPELRELWISLRNCMTQELINRGKDRVNLQQKSIAHPTSTACFKCTKIMKEYRLEAPKLLVSRRGHPQT